MLLTALSAVTTALVAVAKMLWNKSLECEADRAVQRKSLLEITATMSRLEGLLTAYRSCPIQDCPFPPSPGKEALASAFQKPKFSKDK